MDKRLIDLINVKGVNVTAKAIDKFEETFSKGIGVSPENDEDIITNLFIQLGAYAASGINVDEGEFLDDIYEIAKMIRRINRSLKANSPVKEKG